MDRETLEKRPGILFIGSPNVGKRTLISRLIPMDFKDASDPSSESLVYGWTINTKFYTADVSVWRAHLQDVLNVTSLPTIDRIAALVMVFDVSDPLSFDALKDWVSQNDNQKFDILLCIGNKVDLLPGHSAHIEYKRRLLKLGDSFVNPNFSDYGISETEGNSLLGDGELSREIKNSCVEWCLERNIEYIEACASSADFDKCLSIDGDSQGVERLIGALSAHMWPGMLLKSGDQIHEPSLPDQAVLSPTFETTSSKARRKGKKVVAQADDGGESITRKHWMKTEDERLAKAWCNASTNPALGNDQINASFWGLVLKVYNHELPKGWKVRTRDNMRQHFTDVAKRVFAFQNKISELEALNQSGLSFEMKYAQAQTMFEQDYGSPWSDEKAWLVLREQPKWKIWSFEKFKGVSTNATKKLKNIDGDSSPSPFSTPSDTLTADEGDDVQEVSKTIRPMGRKTFKETMKGEGSKDPIVVDLLKQKQEAQMEGEAKYYAMENTKIALAREHYAKLELYLTKKNEIREREQEDRIMEKDVNDSRLSDVQRQYFMKMQEQIFRKRFSQ